MNHGLLGGLKGFRSTLQKSSKTKKGITEEVYLGSSEWCMAKGQEAVGINWNKRFSD